MARLYLKQLSRKKRPLFFVVVAFIVGQIFFLIKGVETVPFFLYGMYSEQAVPQSAYPGLVIELDGQPFPLHELSSLSKDMLLTPVYRYMALNDENGHDPIRTVIDKRFKRSVSGERFRQIERNLANFPDDIAAFPAWFRRYLERITGQSPETIKVFRCGYSFNGSAMELTQKQILFEV